MICFPKPTSCEHNLLIAAAAATMGSSSTALSLPSTSTLIDTKAPRQSTLLTTSLQCSGFPPMESSSQNRVTIKDTWRSVAYCRKLVRNVVTMAAGDAPAIATTGDVSAMTSGDVPAVATVDVPVVAAGDEPAVAGGEAPTQIVQGTEMPDIVKTVQAAWDRVEDKYAVSSLAAAVAVGVWGTSGMISAIDRLPLVPGALELVGIGYSGWFAYKNLIFKPEREALLQKIKATFKDIIGSS